MSKRTRQIQKELEAAEKRKRIVNNGHDDSEDESDSEVECRSVRSTSNQLSSVSVGQIPFSRCGKILAVKLRNFMCHENLTVELDSNANLLIGENGSGKSAILKAIIIGLGCEANETDCDYSIKQLIKKGETSATIEIHLSNNGFNCYERDKYGDKIVVIRQIGASGWSTDQLKSSRGKVISTKRADLQKMISDLNIQVDNPICVLTQDASGAFLRDSDSKKRYELFLKATQLDITIEELNGCTERLRSMERGLKMQQEHSEELKKKYDEARMLISRSKSVNAIKEEILLHERAKKWCGVANEEALVLRITKTLEKANKKKKRILREINERENKEKQLNAQLAQINGSIDALMQSSCEQRQKYEALKACHRRSHHRMAGQIREIKRIEGKKDRIVRNSQMLEVRVANDDNNEIAQLKEEHIKRIVELHTNNEEAQKTITTIKRDIESHQKAQIDGGIGQQLAESARVLDDRKAHLAKLENDMLISNQKIFALEIYEYMTGIAVMTREIEAQKKFLPETEAELSAAMTQKRELENEANSIETKIKEVRQAMKSLDEEKLAKQREKEAIQKHATKAHFVQSQLRTCNSRAELSIVELTNELNAANEKLAKATEIAQCAGDRPESVHSEDQLDEMIKAKERQIRMIDSSNITMEQAQEMFEQCKKHYEQNENLIGSLQREFEQEKGSVLTRFAEVHELKESMALRVSYYFKKWMNLCQFKGQLHINSINETLDVEVIPRDEGQVTEGGGINSLSSGELSYVSVSLLMSLWKCMDHPFFFLEYDFITDFVNRKHLTDIWMQFANKHPQFQYTFLTRPDIIGIEPSDGLSIYRLSDTAR